MIAIVGAGASGLVAAIVAAREGKKVCIFEKNNKVGKKILATGNGRCNITNKNIKIQNFHGQNPGFVSYALSRFSMLTCKEFFEALGIEIIEGAKGRLYPASLQASSVVAALEYEAKRLGVEFFLENEITKIINNKDTFCLYVNDKEIQADKVLIATGSLAMPNLGSSKSGYEIAKSFGHKIHPTFASLTQVITEENLKSISGVKVQSRVSVYADKICVQREFGDVLFTDYGLSGSCILDVSREIGKGLLEGKDMSVKLDICSDMNKDRLKNFLLQRQKIAYDKSIALWLDGFINSKLAKFFAKSFAQKPASKLHQKEIAKLCFLLKEFTLHVKDTKGLTSAEVSVGGVCVEEINPKTLESKIQKNLYFSGEVLDIDADCGGYNLHWAWASGFLAGKGML
jgi:hypothetical protein